MPCAVSRTITRIAIPFGAGVLLLAWGRPATAQTSITGRVISDGDQTPLAGTTIIVTGTTIRTVAARRGTFALHLPADARSLTVRDTGFLDQVVPIAVDHVDYTITLRRDFLHIGGQVVTGLATTIDAKNAANAVAVAASEDVNRVPASTVEQAMQGQIEGALIQQNNGGAPGGGFEVEIRGISSIHGSTSPLYVLDGIVLDNDVTDSSRGVNRISDLNPADIETIEILKAASASAIYGARAGSGVVIITTKKGTPGKPQWHLTQTVGQFTDSRTLGLRSFPTVASAQSWYVNDVTHDTGTAVATDNAFISSVYAGPQDYQAQLFGNRQAAYETDLSVRGTQGGTQYFLSGLTKYDNGVMANTGYAKQSVRTNITERVYSALSVSANLGYIHDDTRRGVTGDDASGISPYVVFSYTPQFANLDHRSPDGSWAVNPFGTANPFADAADIETPQTLSRFIGGGSMNWTPLTTEHQSLQLNVVGGVDRSNLHDLLYEAPNLQVEAAQALPGIVVTNHAVINYSNIGVNLVHQFTGLSNFDFTTSAGSEWDRRELTNPVTVDLNILTGRSAPMTGDVQTLYFSRTLQHNQLLYGQEQIVTLQSRLTLSGGVTAERSTLDGDIHKYYAYPRYSASYRIPKFWTFLDDLKLRAAYGESGNLPPFGARYLAYLPAQIDGANSISVNSQISEGNVKPETERESEVGFDAPMFKSRAQLSASIYRKRITDILLQGGISASSGYAEEFFSGGAFTNSGVELSFSATPIQRRNGFTWVSTETYYRNYSVVNSLPIPPVSLGFGYGLLQVGRSVSELVTPNSSKTELLQIGDFEPSFVMTTSQELTWRQFRVYGLLDWHRGGNVVNSTNEYFDFGSLAADSVVAAKRSAEFIAGGASPFLEPADFIKLRTLILSYTLPQQWTNWTGGAGLHISSARLSVEGRNLLAWYSRSYDGLDPEVSPFGGQSVVRGVEITPYPPARSFFVSLDLAF